MFKQLLVVAVEAATQVSIQSILTVGLLPFVGNTCLQVTSSAMANYQMGPYYDGGNWNDAVVTTQHMRWIATTSEYIRLVQRRIRRIL
jgi:hypothetical protein